MSLQRQTSSALQAEEDDDLGIFGESMSVNESDDNDDLVNVSTDGPFVDPDEFRENLRLEREGKIKVDQQLFPPQSIRTIQQMWPDLNAPPNGQIRIERQFIGRNHFLGMRDLIMENFHYLRSEFGDSNSQQNIFYHIHIINSMLLPIRYRAVIAAMYTASRVQAHGSNTPAHVSESNLSAVVVDLGRRSKVLAAGEWQDTKVLALENLLRFTEARMADVLSKLDPSLGF